MAIDRRQFVTAAAGAALLGNWAGAWAQQPSIETLYEAAKKEGELTWYIVYLPSEDAENLGRAFTARYPGVKVNVVRTTAQVAFQRLNQDLQAESANCDVFSSTDISHYLDLKRRGLLTKYTPAASVNMDKRLQNLDEDGYFHVASVATIGLIYNTDKLKEADAPRSWNDLTDPKWRGLVSVGHPGFSGFVGVWAIAMTKLYGEGWFKKLAANEPQVGRSIIDTITTLASGERSVSAGPMELAASTAAKGNPLGRIVPEEGSILMLSPSAIMSNAPHPNASKLFMEFLVGSEEADQLSIERYGIPKRAGAKPRPGVLGFEDPSRVFLRPTPQESVEMLPEVIELWRDAFGV